MPRSENEETSSLISKKRRLDTASSSSSDDSCRKRKRKDKKNGKKNDYATEGAALNGQVTAKPSAFNQRRNSLGKAARDPRDEPFVKKPKAKKQQEQQQDASVTRTPSPVIDFDGLSRPSTNLKNPCPLLFGALTFSQVAP